MLAMVFGISSCKDDDKEEEFFKSKNFNEALTGLWVSVQGNTYDYFLGTTAKRPEAYGQNVVVAYWTGKFYNCGRPTLTDVDGGMKINGGPEFFQNLVITEYSNSSKSFTVIDHSDDSVRTFVRMSTPELGAIKNVNHTGRSYYVEVQLFENDGSRIRCILSPLANSAADSRSPCLSGFPVQKWRRVSMIPLTRTLLSTPSHGPT